MQYHYSDASENTGKNEFLPYKGKKKKDMRTETQKKADANYRKKIKIVSAQYSPDEMQAYNRIKEFASKNGLSMNSFIKSALEYYMQNSDSLPDDLE